MKKLSKPKQIFLYVAPFPALAFFKIWAASKTQAGMMTGIALAMLTYCGLVIGIAYRWDKPSYLDWAVTAYFAVVFCSLLFWPMSSIPFFTEHAVSGVYACLFAAAFFPPLLGMDPFTNHYAKKCTPQEYWESPIFVKINRIMTYVWSGLFALCLVLSLYPSVLTRALIPLALIVGFGVPFNVSFPDFYLQRLGLPSLAEQLRMAQQGIFNVPSSQSPVKMETPQRAPVASGLATEPKDKPTTSKRKEKIMKVLALNSSPRTGRDSKTELMLNALVEGMQDAGAEVDVYNLRKKTVKPCIGCFTCWTKTPGICVHKDDMSQELYPKWLECDLAVYATPLYHFTLNAIMKAFVERTLPILQPFLEQRGEETYHPLRHEFPRAVFLSVAGFPEPAVFDQLSSWVHFLYSRSDKLVAEIYRPAAEAMTIPVFGEKARDILDATRQAGREIVESSAVSSETMARITQQIVEDKAMMHTMGNLMWKTCMAEGLTPREFAEKGGIPRPDSLESFMLIMPMGFNPDGAGDTRAVLQFNFSGDVKGSCHFKIENREIEVLPGVAQNPDLTIDAPFEVWMDIITGKADGQQMFMEQKYKVAGELSLLMRMNQLFGK
jgi:multimeric flavodoxin WrbA